VKAHEKIVSRTRHSNRSSLHPTREPHPPQILSSEHVSPRALCRFAQVFTKLTGAAITSKEAVSPPPPPISRFLHSTDAYLLVCPISHTYLAFGPISSTYLAFPHPSETFLAQSKDIVPFAWRVGGRECCGAARENCRGGKGVLPREDAGAALRRNSQG
jgi:hypothetical protein